MTDSVENEPAMSADAIAEAMLGDSVTLTGEQVAKKTGAPAALTAAMWRMLGYPTASNNDRAFTKSDVETVKALAKMYNLISVDEVSQEAFARTMGRTFSRLAEWQVRVLVQSVVEPDTGRLTAADLQKLRQIMDLGARVQETVWRRHMAGAATRLALQDASIAGGSEPAAAGFVDIVGFTSRSRSMTNPELAGFIDRFESTVTDLVNGHGGRVVKTIGDEVFFVVDDAQEAGWLAVELVDEHVRDSTFPGVRVGLAYGEVLHRLGDVFGPVVNMASRLTSVAPPGRVIIDPHLAERIKDAPGLKARRLRRISVKGFDSVEPWSLKRAREDRHGGIRGAFEDMLEGAADELALRLPQT